MEIQAQLYDSCFRRELANAIKQDLQSRYPSLSSDWLTYSLLLTPSIAQVIDIFIQEVEHGHIFYDDLFGTTFKKYVASDSPFYCSIEIPRLLCYDFCMMYLSYFYPFINEIYRMQQMTDFVTRAEFRSVYESPNTLMNAIKKQKNTILDKMEKSKKTTYLNTQTYNCLCKPTLSQK